jgi:hypothetical protein
MKTNFVAKKQLKNETSKYFSKKKSFYCDFFSMACKIKQRMYSMRNTAILNFPTSNF